MKKNPGRRERRALHKRARTRWSDKKAAINERQLLRLSKGRAAEETADPRGAGGHRPDGADARRAAAAADHVRALRDRAGRMR